MELNWVSMVYVSIFALLPSSITILLSINAYNKQKRRATLYLLLSMICTFFWILFVALGHLFLSFTLITLQFFSQIPLIICVVLLFDSISRDSADPIKLIVITTISMLEIIFFLTTENVLYLDYTESGDQLVYSRGVFSIMAMFLVIISGVLWLYYSIQIYLKSPPYLKHDAKILLLGGLIVGVVAPMWSLLGFTRYIPGFNFIIIICGELIWTIMIRKEPRLTSVLPFQKVKLLVMNTRTSVTLFEYDWGLKDFIFTGMLKTAGAILNATLKSGDINEIKLEKASLIINRSKTKNFACVLFSHRTSKSLREALNFFTKKFEELFGEYVTDVTNHDQFKDVVGIVSNSFPFVPNYEQ
jgi:hypothetical protein